MKLRFKKSPGKFNLAYFAGDEVEIKDKDLAKKLIEEGYAVEVKSKRGARDSDKQATESSESKRG